MSPFPGGGLDEAFVLAIGPGRTGFGGDVLEANVLQAFAKSLAV